MKLAGTDAARVQSAYRRQHVLAQLGMERASAILHAHRALAVVARGNLRVGVRRGMIGEMHRPVDLSAQLRRAFDAQQIEIVGHREGNRPAFTAGRAACAHFAMKIGEIVGGQVFGFVHVLTLQVDFHARALEEKTCVFCCGGERFASEMRRGRRPLTASSLNMVRGVAQYGGGEMCLTSEMHEQLLRISTTFYHRQKCVSRYFWPERGLFFGASPCRYCTVEQGNVMKLLTAYMRL